MSGINAPQGYTANESSMKSQAQAISDDVEALQDKLKDLTKSEIGKDAFGNAHQNFHGDYKSGMEQVQSAAEGLCQTLASFASTIGAAGQQYAAAEEEQAQAANRSGSGL